MANTTDFDFDSMLDKTLDEIADLPEFKVYPHGAHRCTIGFEKKLIGDHPAVELMLTAIETVELTDPSEVPLSVGDQSSSAYMLDNEFGMGNLKKTLQPLGLHFGVEKIAEILAAAEGAEVLAITSSRKNKKTDAVYLDVVSLQVL